MSQYWVDEQRVEMVPPHLWHTLNMNGLLDVKNQILDKMNMARGKPLYLKPLQDALQRLEVLLALKLNDPRGSN